MEPSVLHEYREMKIQLANWAKYLADLPIGLEKTSISAEDALTTQDLLIGLVKQIQADTFKVVVVGEYSSGKSSLLNVLLRLHDPNSKKTEGLLPTAVTPTTAVITTLVYDQDQSIAITLDDGAVSKISPDQLNGFLTEPALRRKKFWWSSNAEENEHLAAHIRHVRIGCISPLLKEGVELIDTPGIGSVNESHARITKEFTVEADAALFLISVDPPMGEREMTFLQHIKSVTDRCLFIQTKRDFGDRYEDGELVWKRREKEHRRRIEEILRRSDYPFHCVSAYQAARALRYNDEQEFAESGFLALEAELQHFLVAERGVPRIEAWLKRGQAALNQLEVKLRVRREQLEAKLTDSSVPVAQAEDYEQWRIISKAVGKALAENRWEAEEKLLQKKAAFETEVTREALRELSLTSGKQLAENPDRRLKIERSVVRTIQYHSNDSLMPVLDYHIEKALDPFKEAVGENIPKAFEQYSDASFELGACDIDVDFADLVETRTYIRETKRGGLGIVDFFLGAVKTEITEHNIEKPRFTKMVEKAVEEAYRDVKSELHRMLKGIETAVDTEMKRIVNGAKTAADQQTLIQKQSRSECQSQLKENEHQMHLYEQSKADLAEITSAVKKLSASN